MNSSVLVIGDKISSLEPLGCDFIVDWDRFSEEDSFDRKVLVFQPELGEDAWQALNKISKNSPDATAILYGETAAAKTLRDISERVSVYALEYDEDSLGETLTSALELQNTKEQNADFHKLKEGHRKKLENMSQELREVVEKKEKNLERAKKRISTINKQVSGLHKALVAVHKANSIGEVEVLLTSELKEEVNLALVRVYFENQSHLEAQIERAKEFHVFKTNLRLGEHVLGKILFGRIGSSFTKGEQSFLEQVSEGVALAIDRLTKLEQAEHLKREWESTFDAISDPVCLTSKEFKILRTNKAFSDISQIGLRDLIGMNCFRAFLGNSQFPSHLTQNNLRIEKAVNGELQVFEVTAQRINNKESDLFLILFRNITEQQRIEKQMFESAKMAELGTVGSSIAHELNNPLGGLMSFLQLIQMNDNLDPQLSEDIEDMLSAARRCKDIIENLLGFTRTQESASDTEVDLREVVEQALKLIELKTRSSNIDVIVSLPEHPVRLKIQSNLLAQALNHILQNSLDAIEDRLTQSLRFKGRIDVEMWQDEKKTHLKIKDNGVGIDSETQKKVMNPLFTTKGKSFSGLGLTLAYKIIDDHQGQLEVSSQPLRGTEVKISLNNV